MYIVYVKHYLTVSGILFFANEWFSKVYKIICQQNGFVALIHDSSQDYNDCVNIIVKFKDQATLELWGDSLEHDVLVDALDAFRSKNYWEYAVIDNSNTDIKWQKVLLELKAGE